MNNSIRSKSRLWQWPIFLWVVLLFAFSSSAHATPKEFPVPSWLNKVQVADQMIINGIPSLVQHFEAYKEIDELLEFYRRQWNDGSSGTPGYREANVSPWHIISRLDGHYLYTVQVQQDEAFNIKGYLAIADLKAMKKPLKSGSRVPLMGGSKIINDVTSFDPGKKGRTLLLINKYSVASNSNFYRNYYLDRGWGKLMDMNSEGAFIMAFAKHNKETHLVINHIEGSTQVVMNIIEGN